MLCALCGKNPAQITYTQLKGGQPQTLHICAACMAKIEGYLYTGALPGALFDKEETQRRCPGCGSTYRDIAKEGKLGCAQCYRFFKRENRAMLQKIHGNATQQGKRPVRLAGVRAVRVKDRQLTQLRQKLAGLIEEQAFEEAAQVRDEITKLEATND